MGFFIGNISSDWLPDYITNETLSRHTIYGVAFNGATHKGVRLYDAEGKNWSSSNTAKSGIDDFKDLDPFKFKRVLLKPNISGGSASIDSYYGELGITLEQYNQKAIDEGLDKPYWYSRPNKWTWLISPDYIDGFYPCPACYRAGKFLSNWYMGEFMPNNNYRILNGQYPKVNTPINDFRTALRSRGYRASDYLNYQSVLMLSLVKYADLDYQSCLGPGWISGNNIQISAGDTILGDDGYINLSNSSIKVMGITDFYGNAWKYIDGMFQYDRYIFINDDLDNLIEWPTLDTWNALGYKKSDVRLSNASGFISDISYDSQFPFTTYTTAVNNSSYIIKDYYYAKTDGMLNIEIGNDNRDGSYGGPFSWDAHYVGFNNPYISTLVTAFPKSS